MSLLQLYPALSQPGTGGRGCRGAGTRPWTIIIERQTPLSPLHPVSRICLLAGSTYTVWRDLEYRQHFLATRSPRSRAIRDRPVGLRSGAPAKRARRRSASGLVPNARPLVGLNESAVETTAAGMTFDHAQRFLFSLYASSKRGSSQNRRTLWNRLLVGAQIRTDTRLLCAHDPNAATVGRFVLMVSSRVVKHEQTTMRRGTEVVLERGLSTERSRASPDDVDPPRRAVAALSTPSRATSRCAGQRAPRARRAVAAETKYELPPSRASWSGRSRIRAPGRDLRPRISGARRGDAR